MVFQMVENALKEVSGDSHKYHQTAGSFARILKDRSLSPEEQAQELRKVILEGNKAG